MCRPPYPSLRLHSQTWNNPRLLKEFAWAPTHVDGGELEEFRRRHVYDGIRQEVARHQIKREILDDLETNVDTLIKAARVVKTLNAGLPQMLLHGDTHLGNTYRTRAGLGGLYDWQCFSRGFGIHDVTYLIGTSLTTDMRRQHERDLLRFYREELLARGVGPPSEESLWQAHRRQMLVSLFPGWFCTPEVNYGWELLVVGLYRLATATKDLESQQAIQALR